MQSVDTQRTDAAKTQPHRGSAGTAATVLPLQSRQLTAGKDPSQPNSTDPGPAHHSRERRFWPDPNMLRPAKLLACCAARHATCHWVLQHKRCGEQPRYLCLQTACPCCATVKLRPARPRPPQCAKYCCMQALVRPRLASRPQSRVSVVSRQRHTGRGQHPRPRLEACHICSDVLWAPHSNGTRQTTPVHTPGKKQQLNLNA